MSKENNKTITVYEKMAKQYIENSLKHDHLDATRALEKRKELENIISNSFKSIPEGSNILEIGSADGANAKILSDMGYNVTASDVASYFITKMREDGLNAIKFDAVNDELKEKYLAVFCWRVFVHFTKEDALIVMSKVYDLLEDNGIFLFNAINRINKDVDNEWLDFDNEYHMGIPRYYNYFTKEDLDTIISKTPFQIADFYTEGGKNNNKWLVYTLKKHI